jgi:hypothetical protein
MKDKKRFVNPANVLHPCYEGQKASCNPQQVSFIRDMKNKVQIVKLSINLNTNETEVSRNTPVIGGKQRTLQMGVFTAVYGNYR